MKIYYKNEKEEEINLLRSYSNHAECTQAIYCGQTGECLKDNLGRIHISSDSILTIRISYTDSAVPIIDKNLIGKLFKIYLSQRVFEINSSKLKYAFQPDSLLEHIETPPLNIGSGSSLDSLNTDNKIIHQEEIKPITSEDLNKNKNSIISYKPIIKGVLIEFSITTNNSNLTSTLNMVFAEEKEENDKDVMQIVLKKPAEEANAAENATVAASASPFDTSSRSQINADARADDIERAQVPASASSHTQLTAQPASAENIQSPTEPTTSVKADSQQAL